MNSVAQIPEWLTAASSTSYLDFALKTLTKREAVRDKARSISRRQGSPQRRDGFRLMSFLKPESLPAQYTVCVGCQPENALYNRYYQLEPYDSTRVIVAGEQGSGGRYLNANWVLELSGHKWWIATQAPLPNTTHAFLSLILRALASPPPNMLENTNLNTQFPPRSRIRTVVQLTQNFESGRRKAHAYFRSEVGKSLVITPEEGCTSAALKVTLLDIRRFDEAHCIQSTVSIVPIKLPESSSLADGADSNKETSFDDENYGEEISSQRVVFRHMLYTSWPDHGVPSKEDRASLVSFAHLVDEVNRDTSIESQFETNAADPDPPIMVGCSAGIGRTGSFIAISSLLRLMGQLPPPAAPTSATALPSSPLGPLPDQLANDHVVQEVDFLREQRPGMVQRDEQVLFIYQTLAIALGAT